MYWEIFWGGSVDIWIDLLCEFGEIIGLLYVEWVLYVGLWVYGKFFFW